MPTVAPQRIVSDQDLVRLVDQCYDKGKRAVGVVVDPLTGERKGLHEKWTTIGRYLEGRQLEDGSPQAEGLKNRIVKNMMHAYMQTKLARLTDTRPQISVSAPKSNPLFMPQADSIGSCIDWAWDVSDMPIQYRRVNRNSNAYRVGILKGYWDPGADWPRGRLRWDSIMPHNFIPCPNAKDEWSGPWYIHAEPMSVVELSAIFGDAAGGVKPENAWSHVATGIAPYTYGTEGAQTIDGPAKLGKTSGTGGGDGGVMVKEMWFSSAILRAIGIEDSMGYYRDGAVAIVAGGKLLRFGRNPFSREEIEEQDPETGESYLSGGAHGDFPFVRFVCYDNGSFYGDPCDMELLLSSQDEYNRQVNKLMDYNDLRVPHGAVKVGALDEEQENTIDNYPGVIYKIRDNSNVREAFFIDLPPPYGPEAYQDLERTRQDMQTLTGLHDQYAGKTGFSGESGIHASQMIESSDVRVRDLVRMNEAPLERWARLTLGLLAQNMSSDDVFEVTLASGHPAIFQYSATSQEDGTPYYDPQILMMAASMGMEVIQLSRDDLRHEWRVNAEGSSGMPVDKEARLAKFIQLYAAKIVDRQAVLEQSGLPDAAAINERMNQQDMMMAMAGVEAGPPGGGPGNMGVQKPSGPGDMARDSARIRPKAKEKV